MKSEDDITNPLTLSRKFANVIGFRRMRKEDHEPQVALMTGTPFKLAMVETGRAPFVIMVVGGQAFVLDTLYKAWRQGWRGGALVGVSSIQLLLEDWDTNFEALCAMAEFASAGSVPDGVEIDASSVRYPPPITRPGKMIYAAANYGDHIREMLNVSRVENAEDRENMLDRDKARVHPYSFLKAPSALIGAHDDIVAPSELYPGGLGG